MLELSKQSSAFSISTGREIQGHRERKTKDMFDTLGKLADKALDRFWGDTFDLKGLNLGMGPTPIRTSART